MHRTSQRYVDAFHLEVRSTFSYPSLLDFPGFFLPVFLPFSRSSFLALDRSVGYSEPPSLLFLRASRPTLCLTCHGSGGRSGALWATPVYRELPRRVTDVVN